MVNHSFLIAFCTESGAWLVMTRVAADASFQTRETSGFGSTPRREKTAPPQKRKLLATLLSLVRT